jgi:integrase
MPRKANPVPSYTLHKPTGQARCRIGGRDYYLGPFGSDESRRRYGDLVAKASNHIPIDPFQPTRHYHETLVDTGPAVSVLVLAFLDHAERYYVKDGKPSDECACFKSATDPVTDLFGLLPAKDFGPLQLKTVREKYVAAGWSRGYCNKSAGRVRHVFKWGVENGMVPTTTWQALCAVAPLKRGKTAAPDRPKREAVSDVHLNAARKHLSDQCRDLFDLLRFTGARPSELLALTWGMIDRSESVWVATLTDHKTAHHGKERRLYFGPKAQLILRRRSGGRPNQLLFNMHHDTLAEALRQACDKADVPRFSPYHLRHTHGTRVRDTLGIEAAQATLGHASANMTAVYTSKLDKLAHKAAAKCG